MKPLDKLVWMDLETTGLDPAKDLILEVGIVITNRELEEIGAMHWPVKPPRDLPPLHPVVLAMHSKNGLLSELHNAHSIEVVDVLTAALVYASSAHGGPMCGASVHFDKAFIDRHMPLLAKCFTHRCFDTSTLKQAWCQAHGEEWPKEEPAHRALDDIRGSIAVAKALLVSRVE